MRKILFSLVSPLLLVSLLLLTGIALLGSCSEKEPVRPNILFAIADDWGWPHAGIYGDPVVQTPNFDRVVEINRLSS